jgi:nucleotide-binding universal stress UspA family protein
MKTLLVLTDFSPASEKALLYAADLAAQASASLYVLHMYQLPLSMSDVPVLVISADELKNNANAGLEKASHLVKQRYPQMDVQLESRLGDPVDEAVVVANDLQPMAIVVGKRGASAVERFIMGSTSRALVNRSKLPLLAVPENASLPIRRAALAADDADIANGGPAIREFVALTGASLYLLHVAEGNKELPPFREVLPDLNPELAIVRGQSFIEGVRSFIREQGIDLLIVMPHHHGFFERLFQKSHTAELLEEVDVPLLCIPS